MPGFLMKVGTGNIRSRILAALNSIIFPNQMSMPNTSHSS